jgi:hypothetical protein
MGREGKMKGEGREDEGGGREGEGGGREGGGWKVGGSN